MQPQLTPHPERAVRLVSWNIAGRTSLMNERIAAIQRLRPDILALQEATAGNLPALRDALPALELVHVLDSRALAPRASKLTGPRKYGELLASRWPMDAFAPSGFEVPWPERLLSALVRVPGGDVEVHVAHLPTGVGHGWIKIETFQGIFDRLSRTSATPRILCGDFNSPQAERHGGELVTWGQEIDPDGNGTPFPGDENWSGDDAAWDSGERSVLEGLAAYDLHDAFRALNPETEEYSWYWHGGGDGAEPIGRRFDHVFASASLGAESCRYVHEVRKAGLSDHSAVLAEFRAARHD